MSYCISNLHKHQHGTLHLQSEQDVWFKEATKYLDVMVLEKGPCFDDKDLGIHVKYQDPDGKLADFPVLLYDVATVMDSSCSNARKVPSVSCGWSLANPHEYKNNRTNMLGSVSPFLIDGGIDTLPR